MSQKAKHYEITVLFLREGEKWSAQGMNYDIAAQGKTIPEAILAFTQAVESQIFADVKYGKEPLADLAPAPEIYWRRFNDDGVRICGDQLRFKGMPPAFMIAASAEMRVA